MHAQQADSLSHALQTLQDERLRVVQHGKGQGRAGAGAGVRAVGWVAQGKGQVHRYKGGAGARAAAVVGDSLRTFVSFAASVVSLSIQLPAAPGIHSAE